MELFTKLPDELQGLVMSYTNTMCDATPAQLQLLKRMEPYLKEIVLTGKCSRGLRELSWRRRCNFIGCHCSLRFSLRLLRSP